MLMTLPVQEMHSWVKRGSTLLEITMYREKTDKQHLSSTNSKQLFAFFQKGDSLALGINYLERILRCACLQISESSFYFQCNYLHPDPAVTCIETQACQQETVDKGGSLCSELIAEYSLLIATIHFMFTPKPLRNQISKNQMQFLEYMSKLF